MHKPPETEKEQLQCVSIIYYYYHYYYHHLPSVVIMKQTKTFPLKKTPVIFVTKNEKNRHNSNKFELHRSHIKSYENWKALESFSKLENIGNVIRNVCLSYSCM